MDFTDFMNFCIAKTYFKDGRINFIPTHFLSCENVEKAIEFFKKKRFYVAGTYRLLPLVNFKTLTDVTCLSLTDHDIKDTLYTRVFKWEGESFVCHSFSGYTEEEN